MPELPDVQIFAKYLNATALHQKIKKVEVEPEILDSVSSQTLQRRLKGTSLESTRRHGKYLFVALDSNGWLGLHFGMTGFLRYYKGDEPASEHVRLLLRFENGYNLAYDLRRKLGKVFLTDNPDQFIQDNDLGPDPFQDDIDLTQFRKLLEKKRGAIKSALMDQSLMAGIGNVYSDEILFQANIHPKTPVQQLTDEEVKTLFKTMHRVLQTAIDRKAQPDDMPRSYLLPHREPGEPCPKCGGTIEKIKVSGRSSYFCPNHQK